MAFYICKFRRLTSKMIILKNANCLFIWSATWDDGHRAGVSCAALQHVGTWGILAHSRCEKGRYPARSAEDAGAASCPRPGPISLLQVAFSGCGRGPPFGAGIPQRNGGTSLQTPEGEHHRPPAPGQDSRRDRVRSRAPRGGLLEGTPVFASRHRPAWSPRCPKCRKCTECCPEGGAPGPPRRHPPGGPVSLLTITLFDFSK